MPSSHLTDDSLERYLMGQISDELELTRVRRHLSACAACVLRAEAMGEYVATVKEALERDERDGICDPH